jgi:hypothetical protein
MILFGKVRIRFPAKSAGALTRDLHITLREPKL